MNGKMISAKPLYVALAQRKEERKAQLASQFMQKLASIRLQSSGAVPSAMYTPGAGGFFMSSALQNQRTAAFMPATIPGAQMRGSAPNGILLVLPLLVLVSDIQYISEMFLM